MDVTVKLKIFIRTNFAGDNLRSNSSFLILSQVVNAGSLFIFWVICAHLYKTNTVGLATAFISFAAFVSTFTSFGIPSVINRFLATSDKKNDLFYSSVIVVAISSLIGGIVAVKLIGHVIPKLVLVDKSYSLSAILIIMVIAYTLGPTADSALMSFKKSKYVLCRAVVNGVLRVCLPFFFVGLGVAGIVGISAASLFVGMLFGFFIVTRNLIVLKKIPMSVKELITHKNYLYSNFLGGIFGILPATLVPLIVLSRLGTSDAAYFYMPMQIAAFVNILSASTSQALISETSISKGTLQANKIHFKSAFIHLYKILLPTIIVVCLSGWLILRIYGSSYAIHGYLPLVILVTSSIFVAINWLGDTWLNIQQKTKSYFAMNAINSFSVLLFVYIFSSGGLSGVATGWMIGQIISAAIYILLFSSDQLNLGYLLHRSHL